MADPSEIEAAFERGRQVGRREAFGPRGLPREGPLPGAEFKFRRSYFESFAQYERDVVANLRHLQMLRWGREAETAGLIDLEEEARQELQVAKEAVDAELEEGRGSPAVVAALRATPELPSGVREYRNAKEFVEEDERRGDVMPSGEAQLGGADYGSRWGLEHPFKRWLVTSWRVSWLCEVEKFMGLSDEVHSDSGKATTEVYAVEQLHRQPRPDPPRVWLLGKLKTPAAVREALEDLTLEAMGERNSLIVAAVAVARVEAQEIDRYRL
jgi:hypothetical protein